MSNDKPKREPPAETRTFAVVMHQMYVALVDEGFTEQQAMQIIGTALAAQIGKGKGHGGGS